MAEKFAFHCWDCGEPVPGRAVRAAAACGRCGGNVVKVRYPALTRRALVEVLGDDALGEGLWRYFDFLPVSSRANVVSDREGEVPIDRWRFLEDFARRHAGVRCTVYAHRHDCHVATASFKDLAGSLVASALKEEGCRQYAVASTGNIAAAYARYLAAADCTLYAFLPRDSAPFKEADIACFGQNVFRVMGDYTEAKRLAGEFAAARSIPLAPGTFDPFRIEAKRTMAFDWLRRLGEFPTVYIQALSGGTGPLGVLKGSAELIELGLIDRPPRVLLAQSSRCDPMARAWRKARLAGFPPGWNESYEKITDPVTEVPTLATGDPTAYPRLAAAVRQAEGEIFAFPEERAAEVARGVAYEAGVRLGSAGAVGVGGFFESLRRGLIRDGDVLVVTTGEGIQRDPDFLPKLMGSSPCVRTIAECRGADRASRRRDVWAPLAEYVRAGLDEPQPRPATQESCHDR